MSPFYRTIGNETALSYACLKGKNKFIHKFLSYDYKYQNGTDFSISQLLNLRVGKNMNTSLHNAAIGFKGKSLDIFKILIENGADPLICNYQDYTPLDLN